MTYQLQLVHSWIVDSKRKTTDQLVNVMLVHHVSFPASVPAGHISRHKTQWDWRALALRDLSISPVGYLTVVFEVAIVTAISYELFRIQGKHSNTL